MSSEHRPILPLRRRMVDLLAPPLCICCRSRLEPGGEVLCPRCEGEIAMAPPVRLRADGVAAGFAALPYAGAGRRLVAALKFSRLASAATLGAQLIDARAPAGLLAGALVPVPAAPMRTAGRGVDPTLELARALGLRSGQPVVHALRRRDLGHQRGRSRRERLARPPAIASASAVAGDVLLVDDVVTTGATVDACAAALRSAGAGRIVAIALAAVIPGRRLNRPRRRA